MFPYGSTLFPQGPAFIHTREPATMYSQRASILSGSTRRPSAYLCRVFVGSARPERSIRRSSADSSRSSSLFSVPQDARSRPSSRRSDRMDWTPTEIRYDTYRSSPRTADSDRSYEQTRREESRGRRSSDDDIIWRPRRTSGSRSSQGSESLVSRLARGMEGLRVSHRRRRASVDGSDRSSRSNPLENFKRRSRPSRSSHETRSQSSGSIFPGYQFVKKLGKGGMSDAVNLVRKDGKLYVEKRVNTTSFSVNRARAELATLQIISRTGHRNLNQMITSMWGPQDRYLALVLEFCDGGSLQDKLDSHRKTRTLIAEEFMWHVLLGVGNALAFLHAGILDATRDQMEDPNWNAICHLDLKPCNIFLSTRGQTGRFPRVVVGDFGCVVTGNHIVARMEHPRRQECGTREWYPPEGKEEIAGHGHTRYGLKTDTWQCGATIHTLCLLINAPDGRLLVTRYPCGKEYSDFLNDTIMGSTDSYHRERYSSTKIVREAMKGLALSRR